MRTGTGDEATPSTEPEGDASGFSTDTAATAGSGDATAIVTGAGGAIGFSTGAGGFSAGDAVASTGATDAAADAVGAIGSRVAAASGTRAPQVAQNVAVSLMES